MRHRSHGLHRRAAMTVSVPLDLLPPLEYPIGKSLLAIGHLDEINGWFRSLAKLAYDGRLPGDWPIIIALFEAQSAAKSCVVFLCGKNLNVTYNVKWFQASAKLRFCRAIAHACKEAKGCSRVIRVLRAARYPVEG